LEHYENKEIKNELTQRCYRLEVLICNDNQSGAELLKTLSTMCYELLDYVNPHAYFREKERHVLICSKNLSFSVH